MRSGEARPVLVRVPVEPVEAAVEADAVDAAMRASDMAVRGPLFGVATQDANDGPRWRLVVPVTNGCPQTARDGLNSLLWFRAKDEAGDRAERRALLAAVARLESEPVDELTVLGTRYRVVRAEEYAGMGPDGFEQPRPTDPEPLTPDWSAGAREAEADDGLVLDPDAPVTPTQAAERLSLRGLTYAGSRYPDHVLRDSRRALRTHPDVLLLPVMFKIVKRAGAGWESDSGLFVSAHGARRSLDFSLTYWEPRSRGLIPLNADRHVDARTRAAEGADAGAGELAAYAEAADRLREGRVNELEVLGTLYRIGRIRRLLRWGPDGPEGPRPSDVSHHEPGALHPVLDEDGTIHFDEDDEDEGDDA
ncbi:hypothetical protein FH609_004015 [Streptomyces sp. 3MP-14]|uniref:PE-PGRS family protein n=2 Tax=Streptomyces TaxID=1883 RepID=A0A5N6A6H3_9ACTN|nr:hypothetical protein FH607_019880 [Streptomyces mimosae]KAB8179288.1 hypothetical protein FH609_004015 [Streptomyces sp. 3MP-14]